MKVTFTLSIGIAGATIAGATYEDTVDLPDDCTDEQIEKAWQDWAWNYIDGSWTKEIK